MILSDTTILQEINKGTIKIDPFNENNKKTNMQEFIPLQTSYKKFGYNFELLERTGDVAIFKQLDEGKIIAYEVFEVIKQKEWEAFGKVNPAKEAIPSTESWGTNAFTCATLERAKERVDYLQNRIAEREANGIEAKINSLPSYVA